MKRHLVVCGGGDVGSFVIDVLLGKALHVRATTPRRSQVNAQGPIAWTYLDIATGEGLAHAFAAIDRAVLVLPTAMEKPHAALARCLREARRRHLDKVVVVTDAGDDHLDEWQRTLGHSGLPHALLRSSAGDDPRSIAASAVELLAHDVVVPRDRDYPDNPGVLNAA